jgi:hypothetical protein
VILLEVVDLQMIAGLTNPEKPPPDSPLGPAAPRRGHPIRGHRESWPIVIQVTRLDNGRKWYDLCVENASMQLFPVPARFAQALQIGQFRDVVQLGYFTTGVR